MVFRYFNRKKQRISPCLSHFLISLNKKSSAAYLHISGKGLHKNSKKKKARAEVPNRLKNAEKQCSYLSIKNRAKVPGPQCEVMTQPAVDTMTSSHLISFFNSFLYILRSLSLRSQVV